MTYISRVNTHLYKYHKIKQMDFQTIKTNTNTTNTTNTKHPFGYIFCDGACSGNGKKGGGTGGWSWAFWHGPNLSNIQGEPAYCKISPLPPSPPAPVHTNQRAELTALLEAVRWVGTATNADANVTIFSDSMYAINCASVWGPGWKRRKWTKPTPGPIQNLDLIQPLVDLYDTVKDRVCLQHVRGHQTVVTPQAYGNSWVDGGAVAGAGGLRLERLGLDVS